MIIISLADRTCGQAWTVLENGGGGTLALC
jgi:hypothetical protein